MAQDKIIAIISISISTTSALCILCIAAKSACSAEWRQVFTGHIGSIGLVRSISLLSDMNSG